MIEKFQQLKITLIDFIEYYKIRLFNKSYSEYYANRMNRIVKNNPNWGLNLNKKFQLEFLIDQGLKKNDKFLDYGCGALAAGVLFVDFLNKGKYFGVDISFKAIEEGQNRIISRSLLNKEPQLYLLKSGKADFFSNHQFDIIWSQSVFTHLPPKDAQNVISILSGKLNANGKFYFNFCLNSIDQISQKNYKDWYYPLSFFEDLSKKMGFNIEVVEGWNHPDDFNFVDTLLMVTKN
jgi:SAM-dependent methyltransferase